MKSINQHDTILQVGSGQIQGTTIIAVMPQRGDSIAGHTPKKNKKKGQNRRQRLQKIVN